MSTQTPAYEDYHRAVVEACVRLMGEENRQVFEETVYLEEFHEKHSPDSVAYGLWKATR